MSLRGFAVAARYSNHRTQLRAQKMHSLVEALQLTYALVVRGCMRAGMIITALQKAAALAIVNVFETGSVRGDYTDVTLIPGDTGELTYGRTQTTLASGNLFLLIKDYTDRSDAIHGSALQPYLGQLESRDATLNHDAVFRGLLTDAGNDPVMQEVQDAFFDRIYWQPALRSADALGAKLALSAALVYDSTVHGSWAQVRDLTRQRYGELARIGEKTWMTRYVDVRRGWLAASPNTVLHKTVYRMDAFAQLIKSGNWTLRLPFTVRGQLISTDTLAADPPVRAPADSEAKRILRLTSPPMTGADVVWLQQRLAQAGFPAGASGIFDEKTEAQVRAFQKAHALKTDGAVGPDTRAALEDLSVTHPADTLEANAPMPGVARTAASAPAASSGADASADIKAHVTNETQAVVAQLTRIVEQEHAKLSQQIAGLGSPGAVPAPAAPAVRRAVPSAVSLAPVLSNSRSLVAVAMSAIVFGLAQLREFIDWIASLLHPAANAPPAQPGTLTYELRQLCAAVHNLLASLPPEWAYRVRMAAFLLLCYVLYLLIARHFDIQKLQQEIAQGQEVEQDLAKLAKPG
jgi:chitosanase